MRSLILPPTGGMVLLREYVSMLHQYGFSISMMGDFKPTANSNNKCKFTLSFVKALIGRIEL